jgi:arylformamidase
MTIIDISITLSPDAPVWPGSQGFHLSWSKKLNSGDSCNNSQILCDSHTGTHLDAPLHYIESGVTIDQIPLEILIGPCSVIYLPNIDEITSDDLAKAKIDMESTRLLIRTDNSKLWTAGETDFKEDFCALTPDAAQWIVDQKIYLIGIDYLSIAKYKDGDITHQLLLGSGLIVLEGLNLSGVMPGEYELICLPLNVKGAEGAPARAVLRKR